MAAVLDGAANDSSAQDGVYTVAFTEAVYRSAAEKQIVTLDPLQSFLHTHLD